MFLKPKVSEDLKLEETSFGQVLEPTPLNSRSFLEKDWSKPDYARALTAMWMQDKNMTKKSYPDKVSIGTCNEFEDTITRNMRVLNIGEQGFNEEEPAHHSEHSSGNGKLP